MRITGRLGDNCPNGVSCPRVHDTDTDDVVVQGERVTDPKIVEQVGGLPAHEELVTVPRAALYPPELTPDELADWIFGRFTHEVVRLEGRDRYTTASDSEAGKAAWQATLDGFRGETPPRKWRVVHLLRGEPSDYERYEFETYLEHIEHGEDVRVFAVPPGEEASLDGVPDLFVIDREHVVRAIYDSAGAMLGGQVVTGPDAAVYRALALALLAASTDLRDWTASRHRGAAA